MRTRPWSTLVIFGLPTALAALLLPALFLLNPSLSSRTAPASQSVQQTAAAPQEIVLKVDEWSFAPKQLQLQVGAPVKLVLDNQGKLEHDVSIPSLGVLLKAGPGKSASQTITPAKEGAFDFLCSIPGHKEAGMQGKAVVATGAGAAASAAQPSAAAKKEEHGSHAAVASTAARGNQPLDFIMDGDTKVFELKAQHVQWEVLPGEVVDAYAYNGQVPGPIIRATEGENVRITFLNELPESTVIHFHGPRLPNRMDGVVGVTQKVVEPGQSYAYEFVAQPGGTFMYHTHHNSAEQKEKGLYGVFIIDPLESTVEYDREVIQVLSEMDGYFLINGKAFPATEPIEASIGERVLVRLVNLGQMSHPMHMHGHPFKIVSTDGFPVPPAQALTKDVVNIGPGERYDILMTSDNPGTWLFHCHILTHVQNHGEEPGGMITVVQINE